MSITSGRGPKGRAAEGWAATGRATIGLDVGGTKVAAVLVESTTGTVLDRERASSAGSATDLVATLTGLVGTLRSRSAGLQVEVGAVGLGIAGLVDRDGVVRWSPNLPASVDHPVAAELASGVGLPVVATNDATAATLAESRLGAGRGCDDVALVTLGTGIGAGFVVDGRLLRGAHGFAGEPGHMVVDPGGPEHLTGQRGPWEALASGNALGRMATEAGFESGPRAVAAMADGDATATDVFDRWCREVARGLANLVVVLDSRRIVLGGGLVEVGEPLRLGVASWLARLTPGADSRPAVEVVLAELGSDAGALGAGLLAGDQVELQVGP